MHTMRFAGTQKYKLLLNGIELQYGDKWQIDSYRNFAAVSNSIQCNSIAYQLEDSLYYMLGYWSDAQ